MYPLSALPEPALPIDHLYRRAFGGLPLETLQVVVRSIAPDERTSLLNLALVNKDAYFATRERRGWLALRAASAGPTWRPTEIAERRNFRHALHMVRSGHPTLHADALLSHWIGRLCPLEKGMFWRGRSRWPLPMIRQLLQELRSLPMRECSDLLWELLVAQHRMHNDGESRSSLLDSMRRVGNELLGAHGHGFLIACDIAGWRDSGKFADEHDSDSDDGRVSEDDGRVSEDDGSIPDDDGTSPERAWTAPNLIEACERCLRDPDAWPQPVLAMMLEILASHLQRLPSEKHTELALRMLDVIVAWPVLHRARILGALLVPLPHVGSARDVADRIAGHMLKVESMLEEGAALNDEDRLGLLEDLLHLIERRDVLHGHCSDEAQVVAALDSIESRIGERFIGQFVTLPYAGERHFRLNRMLETVMHRFYRWNRDAAQWQAGFDALCRANRRAHGVSYGVPNFVIGENLFKHRDMSEVYARRNALRPLLEKDANATGADRESATWRLFIKVIENHRGSSFCKHPRDQDEGLLLRNAEALLAQPDLMTPAAWAELMQLTLSQISTPKTACPIVHQVLLRADAIPDAQRVDLFVQIVWTVESWKPAYQSSAIDLLLSVAATLAERERARLLPELFQFCLCALSQNSDARLWFSEIMRLFDGLPDPLKMHALESALDYPRMNRIDPAACAALLPELEQQIATLPARPQAWLLLNLSLFLGRIRIEQSQHMLRGLMDRLDKLNLPQPERKAWQLQCQAACMQASAKKSSIKPARHYVSKDIDALPEPLRLAVLAMLDEIDALPWYPKTKADDKTIVHKGSGCVIA